MKKGRATVKQRLYNRALRIFPGHLPADPGQLLYEVRRQTGCRDFGDPLFLTAYQILYHSIRNEVPLHAAGRRIARGMLESLLVNRLSIEHMRQQAPSVSDERVERPIFILGMPRTGSTFLQRLLCSLPGLRGLRMEQLLMPAPRPGQNLAALYAERRRRFETHARFVQRLSPELDHLHHVSAASFDECYLLIRNSFMHTSFHYLGSPPSYMLWLSSQDMGPAYRDYCYQLQLLQNQEPGGRWVLKSPAHWNRLDVWRATFPDACVIQTHRSMDEVIPSLLKLLAASKKLFTPVAPEDEERIQALRSYLTGRLLALKAARQQIPAERQVDIKYEDLVRDPSGTVRLICQRFGLPFDAGTVSAMARYIEQNSRERKP